MAKKSKKAMLKAFGERYYTMPEGDTGYCLYDKLTPGKTMNYRYIGEFYLGVDAYVYNKKNYNTPEELIAAMEEYNKTLPFDIEIYNPGFRKNYSIELAVREYLTSLGFKIDRLGSHRNSTTYTLLDVDGQILYQLNVRVDEDATTGSVLRFIGDGSKWTESPFTDMDSAIAACNSLIATYGIALNAQMMSVLNKLTASRANEILNKTFDIKTLNVFTEDGKKKAIEMLEAELKKLKEE